MSKSKKRPQQPKVRSAVAVAAFTRGGAGVHKDQKRRTDHRALRRDRSYKFEVT